VWTPVGQGKKRRGRADRIKRTATVHLASQTIGCVTLLQGGKRDPVNTTRAPLEKKKKKKKGVNNRARTLHRKRTDFQAQGRFFNHRGDEGRMWKRKEVLGNFAGGCAFFAGKGGGGRVYFPLGELFKGPGRKREKTKWGKRRGRSTTKREVFALKGEGKGRFHQRRNDAGGGGSNKKGERSQHFRGKKKSKSVKKKVGVKKG